MASLKYWDGSAWQTTSQGPAQNASQTAFTPTGTIASTDVQSAIAEVANEYPSNGAWTSFTPTFTNGITALGNATNSSKYKLLGDKTILVKLFIVWGTTTTYNGSTVTLTSPTGTVASGSGVVGVGTANGTFGNIISFASMSANTIIFARQTSTTNGTVVGLLGTDFNAAGQGMNVAFTYELS